MPVSSGLQKYFDSKRKKDGEMQKKFSSLASQIDPAFMQSFDAFRERILEIVDDTEDSVNIVCSELDDLSGKIEEKNRIHNLKKASSLIDATEKT